MALIHASTTETASPELMGMAISHLLSAIFTASTDRESWEHRRQLILKQGDRYASSSSGVSTVEKNREEPQDLYKKLEILFARAKDEDFEDGVESAFATDLGRIVREYRVTAVEALATLIVSERGNAAVASEALRWIARIEDPESYAFRLWLLERSLLSSSSRVRDAAALGIASLDDPHAIPQLRTAINAEQCVELRQDMEQVLEQLESTSSCRSS